MKRAIILIILGLYLTSCGHSKCLTSKPIIYTLVKFKTVYKKKIVYKKRYVPVPAFITIKHIHFETNSWELTPDVRKYLVALGKFLKKYPKVHLRIEGHTDHRGLPGNNNFLSIQRALQVADFLFLNRISPFRLTIRAYGETQRIDVTETEEGMKKNRRVEFHIIKT